MFFKGQGLKGEEV